MPEDTESTTFTFKKKTKKDLFEMYPDAISVTEALRNAIADARLIRDPENRLIRVALDDHDEE